jgi:hypothetical protein
MPSAKRWRERRESLLDFEEVDGCWIWRGRIDPNGYGTIGRNFAHRVMYERHVGPIPKGLHLDHLCRVRSCVNPKHLEAVSCAENVRRSDIVGKHPKLAARRLSEEAVRYIRASRASNRTLARQYGVSHETIRLARSGRQYGEVA